MAKLNQILAVEKGMKTRIYARLTDIHRTLGKAPLLSGISRVYQPKNEDGEKLPPEEGRVQVRVGDMIDHTRDTLAPLWEVTATKAWANTKARGTVLMDDESILLEDVPVDYLLFLEKQLNDIHTFVSALPVLDGGHEWEFDPNSNAYRTQPVQTIKTKKEPRAIVLYPATPEHPAQTQLITDDITVGTWQTTLFSGAIPALERDRMVERVEELQRAVKKAREGANDLTVEQQVGIADVILNQVFGVNGTPG